VIGDLYALKARLGGVVFAGGRAWLGPGPGHSRQDRSLSVRLTDDDRPLVHSFAGDPFRDCAQYLGLEPQAGPDARPSPPPRGPKAPPEPDPKALEIWRGAIPHGPVVATYLVGRGITGPAPPSLRQGTGMALGCIRPSLVAGVQAPDGGVIAVQRLFLTWDGNKAPTRLQRITTGRLREGAVRLAGAGPVLGLAEGVETALAAQQLAGVPVWASLGAERLPLVRIPPEVRELHLFADADETGERAAQRAAERHVRRGLKVLIRRPPEGFGDWADLAAGRGSAA
jgi:hypothetical protein